MYGKQIWYHFEPISIDTHVSTNKYICKQQLHSTCSILPSLLLLERSNNLKFMTIAIDVVYDVQFKENNVAQLMIYYQYN